MRGWEKKLRVWLDWNLDLFFKRDISRLKVFKKETDLDYKELDEVDDAVSYTHLTLPTKA